jgi:hypothetical protein
LCFTEILITLICPNDSILANPDALLLFKRFSAIRFIDLLDVLLDRLSNADIRTLIRLDLLQYYLVVLFNINFIRLLCDLHVSAINYLKPIQKRLNAVAETNVIYLLDSINTLLFSTYYILGQFIYTFTIGHFYERCIRQHG